MAEVNQGQVIATAWEWVHKDGPVDQVFNSQALLSLLRDGGYQEYADGGRLFEMTLEFRVNGSFKSVSELELLDTTRYDVFDCARYEQRLLAGTVVWSNLEELRNSVENRKVDVIKKKLSNATNSAMEILNIQLFADGSGNGGKDFSGLQQIIPANPTVGSVGGINAGLWAFWRSKQVSGANGGTTPFDNLPAAMESAHNQASLGGVEKKPTGIITDRASFEGYISTLTKIERLVGDSSGKAKPDVGWMNDAVAFKGVPTMYDEMCPAQTMWMINTAFLKLIFLKGAWMKMLKQVEPANQLAMISRILTVGNLTATARRHLATVTGIT